MDAKKRPDFNLIETMLWENGRLFLLDLHLDRVEKSARELGFLFDREFTTGVLESSTAGLEVFEKCKVRLLLSSSGKVNISVKHIDLAPVGKVRITVSEERVSSGDPFMYHKTSRRDLYNSELARVRDDGYFEVLFLNENGEVTEGAISNVIIRDSSGFWTPPVKCGLLPGVFRKYLLLSGEMPLKEKVLHIEDLLSADGIFIINSVMKVVPAELKV